MQNSIYVRAARASDQDTILAFCRNTFHWGDYISEVWNAWLADTNGQLFVGVVDEQTVGLLHAALHADASWLEGMRVHPDFRRRHVASAMTAAAGAWARARGCRVARLATSIKNIPAQHMLAANGYRRIAQFNEWSADPAPRDFSAWRVAGENDLPAILATWEGAAARAASSAVVPDRHWRWCALTPARLREQIRAGEVRLAPNGFALLLAFDENDWHGLTLHALAGDADTAHALALAARGEAASRGYAHLEAMLADEPGLSAALEHAGYRRDSAMLIYEQDLE